MTELTIQCPTCGLHLVHGEKILSRVQGRRGATRCPRCRDRVHFDATGETLRISFPDLLDEALDETAQHSSQRVETETVNPPQVISEPNFSGPFEEKLPGKQRVSEVVVRTPSELPPGVMPNDISQPPLPGDLMPDTGVDGEPVFLLLPSKRVG